MVWIEVSQRLGSAAETLCLSLILAPVVPRREREPERPPLRGCGGVCKAVEGLESKASQRLWSKVTRGGVQGHLAHKKTHTPPTLPQAGA